MTNLERIATALERIADHADQTRAADDDTRLVLEVAGSPHPLRGAAAVDALDEMPDGTRVWDDNGHDWEGTTGPHGPMLWTCQCDACAAKANLPAAALMSEELLRWHGPVHMPQRFAPLRSVDLRGYARRVRAAARDAADVYGGPAEPAEGDVDRLRGAWLDGAQERVARVLSGGLWDSLDDQDRADLLAMGRAAAAAALPVRTGGDHE